MPRRTRYYLVRVGGTRNLITGALWAVDLQTGQRRRLLPDFQMIHFSISPDGQRVVFVASDESGRTPVWLAPPNGRTAPLGTQQLEGVFRCERRCDIRGRGEAGLFLLYQVREDESGLRTITSTPILDPVQRIARRTVGGGRGGPSPETRTR
jgi:hypothetical protein